MPYCKLVIYSYTSQSGLTGENCSTTIDWCQMSNCSQPGTIKCLNHQEGYTCECKPEYSGWCPHLSYKEVFLNKVLFQYQYNDIIQLIISFN